MWIKGVPCLYWQPSFTTVLHVHVHVYTYIIYIYIYIHYLVIGIYIHLLLLMGAWWKLNQCHPVIIEYWVLYILVRSKFNTALDRYIHVHVYTYVHTLYMYSISSIRYHYYTIRGRIYFTISESLLELLTYLHMYK